MRLVYMKRLRPFFLLVTAFLIRLESVWPQGPQAAIRGHVSVASGSPASHIRVTAINEETGEARHATTGADGEFTIPVLSPGLYRVEAELTGTARYVSRTARLEVGQTVRWDILLPPGGPSEQVIVTAPNNLLKTDGAGLSMVIENRQITNIPLDGRNFLELSLLLPGAAPAAQGSPGSVRGEFTVNINGAREDSNNFILDGVFNNDPKLNTFAINPPVDAIREFEVLAGSYDAAFGRSGGAQVNVALKSGSNQVHGTAYEFFRNAMLDARNYFARPEDPAPRYQRNQFGGSLGGPVRKNGTFFFSDYEGRRMREGITQVTNVPTALERSGDFSKSNLPRPIDPYTQHPFDGNRIPADRISPTGKSIAALYPMPNRAVAGQNYVSSPVLRDREDRFDLRLDHSLSARSNLMTRYSFSDRDLYEPFSGTGFSRVPGFGARVPRRAQNAMIGDDHIFSPALVNQARFAFNRVAAGAYQESRPESLNRKVGLPEISPYPRDFGLSFINISAFSPIGDEYNNPQHSVTNVWQATDTVSWSKGKHLIKFGGEFRSLQQNAFRDVQSRGFLTFSDYAQVTGNGLADLLLGFITYSGGARLENPQYLRTKSGAGFVQDSWRVRRNTTILMGLRYEYNSPPVDRYDRANVFDAATGALVRVGKNGIPRAGYEPDRNNWAPRVGISWEMANRTVLRAGYGVYYDQSSLAPGEGLYFNKPYYDFRLFFPLPGMPLQLNNPFPANYPFAIPASALGYDRNLRSPYFQHWNLSLQRQFGDSSVAEVTYVGSKGAKILSARDVNQPESSPRQPNPRPQPQFADINYLEGRGNSSHHSLQARFQQRFRDGLTGMVAYTFGKSIDVNSTFFSSFGDSNFPQNSRDPGAERGLSNFDVRHRLSIAFSYDLPFGKGKRILAGSGFASALLGGWSAHGIVTAQSGRPFTVALLPELDNSNTGIGSLGFGANNRPNRTSSGELASRTPEQWFDTRAFAIAPYGSFGNSGRNILEGPAYQDISLSLVKNSAVGERMTIQFRSEIFNLSNNTNLGLPDIFWGSPSFGRISSAASPRRIQFGLKLIF
jgi:hypothetical protein